MNDPLRSLLLYTFLLALAGSLTGCHLLSPVNVEGEPWGVLVLKFDT